MQGRANITASPTWSVQATGYYRDLDRRTFNGDEAEFEVCDDDRLPAGAPEGTLCFGDDDDDDDDADDDGDADDDDDDVFIAIPLIDRTTQRFITALDAVGDGAINRTATRTRGYGATVQATARTSAGSRENMFLAGVSVDLADIDFSTSSEGGLADGGPRRHRLRAVREPLRPGG